MLLRICDASRPCHAQHFHAPLMSALVFGEGRDQAYDRERKIPPHAHSTTYVRPRSRTNPHGVHIAGSTGSQPEARVTQLLTQEQTFPVKSHSLGGAFPNGTARLDYAWEQTRPRRTDMGSRHKGESDVSCSIHVGSVDTSSGGCGQPPGGGGADELRGYCGCGDRQHCTREIVSVFWGALSARAPLSP